MCGIAGIYHRRGARVAIPLLTEMADTLAHRGPDDAGTIVLGAVGLAHRRLAILDLSAAGHQPMQTSDGRYTLVFNGEIYNYRELADSWLPKHQLKSHSDTEVLLYLLAERGREALPLLRGMFAFACWDAEAQSLLLARDPFGKKPLYYTSSSDIVLFASEPKALLVYPGVASAPDPVALTKYLLYEYVPGPATGWQGIAQVPLGTALTITAGTIKSHQWWQPRPRPKLALGARAAERELDRHLSTAVRRRLVADVPVGLLLSGGLDSTTIGWYMQRERSGPLYSFSVGFAEPTYNETAFAELAAAALHSQHQVTYCTPTLFADTALALIPFMDIPLADASLIPTYLVSRAAREHVTVVLDGDGSDELLGGYGTFAAAALAEKLRFVPSTLWHHAARIVHALPTNHAYFSFDFKLKSFVRGLPYSRLERNQVWLGSFTASELSELLQPPWRSAIPLLLEDIRALAPALAGETLFDALSVLTALHYLHNDILVKLDRAAMACGLEARTPFLDVDLAEFLLRLPPELKRNKRILRRLMRGRIPTAIIDRPKQGFGTPLGAWLAGPLATWARSILAPDVLAADGILVPDRVNALLDAHQHRTVDARKQLWTLITFQLWYDHWVVGRDTRQRLK